MNGNGHKVARSVKNREEYFSLRNNVQNRRNLILARDGDEKAKARLVQFNYNDILPDGVLKGCCHPASTFAGDVDCNDKKECADIAQRFLELKEEIGLLELSRSARYGLHYVCLRKKGTTILENQVRVSMLTKTEMDTSAHDLQRVMFTVTADSKELLFLDDRIFDEPLCLEESASEYEVLKEREKKGLEKISSEAKKAIKHYRPWEKESSNVANHQERENSQQPSQQESTEVVPVSERTRFIVRGVMKEKGLEDRFFHDIGGRHNSVKILLTGLTQLLKREETNGVLAELMPDNWQDKNIQQLVNDFYKNYTNPNQRLLRYQEDLFTKSRKLFPKENEDTSSLHQSDQTQKQVPPQMPKTLPPLIKLLTKNTPDIYKEAVAHAVFPALGAHLHKVRFRYIDNVEHEATLMNVLMAGTGAGKDCISEPINHIMADIRQRDAENLAREKVWKDEVNRKGANKDKRQRPEGLVIQEIDADMTGPAFVMRMAEADGHFLYTKLNEIDQFDALKGNGRSGQQFQIMCLAFDPGNRYGQTRVGTQSVTEKVCVRFNWNATTTILKGQRYFSRVLTDGPISRINFCTIPEREIGADMPIYGTYDAAFDEELRPYIERLCGAHGIIDCPKAYKLVKKLKNECADFARLSQSRTYENLSFRALVIAYLKACVLYVAHDYTWNKTMEDFMRWSLQYDLWCKMRFFGEAIDQASGVDSNPQHPGPRNLLELLPNEFSMEDAINIRQRQGLSKEGTRDMIRAWRNRGYIEERTDEQLNSYIFTKLKYRN
jgi:hypothetical protein